MSVCERDMDRERESERGEKERRDNEIEKPLFLLTFEPCLMAGLIKINGCVKQ